MVGLPLRPAMLGAGVLLASFSIASADDLGACNAYDSKPDDAIPACSRVLANYAAVIQSPMCGTMEMVGMFV
jgi:hypothetical protein